MATDTTVKQVLALLATNYPEQVAKLSETELSLRRQLFVQALADIDDETLKAACLRHVATSPFFPKVSELRAAAVAITCQPSPDPVEAWGVLRKAMSRYGAYGVPCGEEDGWGYRPPVFDDPIINHLVKQFGWRELCLSDEDTAMSDRARFLDAYARLAQRERQQDTLPAALRDGAMSHRQLAPGDRDPQALVRQIAGAMSANSRS